MTNKRDLKAYVRYDGSGRVIAGSLVLRRAKPKVGDWKEVQGYECCTSSTLTTTVAANLSAASPLKVKLYCGNASSELLSTTGWTLGSGWTGSFSTGFTHASGTATLTNSLAAVNGGNYRVIVTVTGTVGTGGATLQFGNVTTSTFGTAAGTFAFAITATSTGSLTITPATGFTGTVSVSIVKMPAIALTLSSVQSGATSVSALASALNSTYPVLGTFSNPSGNTLQLIMSSAQKQAICSESKSILMTVTA